MARMRAAFLIPLVAAAILGCSMDPFGPTEGRPGIPIPERYEDAVPLVSEVLVIAEAPARSFTPLVTAAYSSTGSNLGVPAGSRASLVTDGEIVGTPLIGAVETQPLADGAAPLLRLVRYWRRLGDAESYAGSTTTTRTRTVTRGASQTSTQTFTETLSVEAESEAGGLFASASVKVSASFTATQEFSQTTSTEYTEEQSFTVAPVSGTNLMFSVWQLVEEYRYVDVDGELYDVPAYEFDESCLRFLYPTDEIVPISAYYGS